MIETLWDYFGFNSYLTFDQLLCTRWLWHKALDKTGQMLTDALHETHSHSTTRQHKRSSVTEKLRTMRASLQFLIRTQQSQIFVDRFGNMSTFHKFSHPRCVQNLVIFTPKKSELSWTAFLCAIWRLYMSFRLLTVTVTTVTLTFVLQSPQIHCKISPCSSDKCRTSLAMADHPQINLSNLSCGHTCRPLSYTPTTTIWHSSFRKLILVLPSHG